MILATIRLGWPNTAVIAALAMLPLVALMAPGDRPQATVQTDPIEPVAICQSLACATIATAAPETFAE
jgi:hypothetical protein